MAQQTINIGAAANDGTGDPARTAFGKVNDNFTELYAQSGHGVIGSTVTTKQDDYAPTGWATCRVLRWNGAGSTGFTGLDAAGIADGAERVIVNASTDYLLWLENQNTASAAANRLALPKGFPAFLMPGDTITLIYDLTSTVWRVKEWPNQGPAMGLTEFTDFLKGAVGGTWAYSSGTGSSAVSISAPVSAELESGVNALSTGTTTTGKALCSPTWRTTFGTLGSKLVVGRVSLAAETDGTETYTAYVGLVDVSGFVCAIAWEYRWTGSATEWTSLANNNSSITRSTSGAPTPRTDGHVALAVYVNTDGTRADFLVCTDGVAWTLANSLTTNLPTAGLLSPCLAGIVKSAGTTARTLRVDYGGARVDMPIRNG